MKRLLLLLTLCTGISVVLSAQASEMEQIQTTLNYYLQGGTNNDFETLSKAFHTSAMMKFMRNGEFTEVNAIEYFKSIIKPGPAQDRETRIESIDISGNVASARLVIDYPKVRLTDHMSLMKVDGEWKIVNKLFSRETR